MGEESVTAFARAGELLEGAEPTPTVARVLSRLAIRTNLSAHFDETIEFCSRALTIADQFGLEDIRGHVLNTQGVARISRGDLGGLADLEASIEIAEQLNAADALIRGYKNFGSVLAELGELERSAALHQRGADAAHRFGADYQSRWFETELGIHAYWAGDWDSTEAAFNRLGEWVTEVGPHYMEAAARSFHAQIRVARGDLDGAHRDIESSLDFARRSADLQMLLPTLGDAALVAAITGAADSARRVADLFDELATAIGDGAEGGYWAVAAALALALTEQAQRLAVASIGGPSRWTLAARLIVEGRFVEAAAELAAIGGRPEEALARLLAARSLIGRRQDEAEAQLRLAVGFWEGVGATRLAALAEALVARSA
jgi:tetratricopeptide (TPR) repeat protein